MFPLKCEIIDLPSVIYHHCRVNEEHSGTYNFQGMNVVYLQMSLKHKKQVLGHSGIFLCVHYRMKGQGNIIYTGKSSFLKSILEYN